MCKRMFFHRIVFLFAAATLVESCTRTRFGCCLDGSTPSTNPEDVGCPQPNTQVSSTACASYIRSLPGDCKTTTNCRKIVCNVEVVDRSVEVTIAIHRCTYPISFNVTIRAPSTDFVWNHLFAGKTVTEIVGLSSAINSVRASFAAVNVTSDDSGRISASFVIRPSFYFYGLLSFGDIIVLPNKYVPVDTSDCSVTSKPSQTCDQPDGSLKQLQGVTCSGGTCVWPTDGGSDSTCYRCPKGQCAKGTAASRVCGSNGLTYETDCHLRQDACGHYIQIQVTRDGPCDMSDVTTPPPPVNHLPKTFDDLDASARAFLRDYVVYIIMKPIDSSYTQSYIESQLGAALGYNVVFLDSMLIFSTPGFRALNVTYYAYYLHSKTFLTVKAKVLISDMTSKRKTIEANLLTTVENFAQLNVPEEEDENGSSNIVVIVVPVVVCLVCVVLLVGLGIYIATKRRREATGSEDVSYLPQHDEVSIQQTKAEEVKAEAV